MNWANMLRWTPLFLGVILFFVVPIVLWVIVFLIAGKKNNSLKFFGLIVGSDNRLSLSRLQAFAWTLVIFGSYFAAMAVHQPINPNVQAEADAAKQRAETAVNKVKSLSTDLELAKTKFDNVTKEKNVADKANTESLQRLNTLKAATNPPTPPETIQTATADAEQTTKELTDKTNKHTEASKTLEDIQKSISDAEKSAQTAKEFAEIKVEEASKEKWVDIPIALLALAGIAVGSGIFSSLISAVNSEEKTAGLRRVETITADKFNVEADYPQTPVSNSNNLLRIVGTDMGSKKGKVRFGEDYSLSREVETLYWKSDGTEIIVDVPDNIPKKILIVDTPNGKLTRQLLGAKELEDAKKQLEDFKNKEQNKAKELAEAEAEWQKLKDDGANQTEIEAARTKAETAKTEVDNLKIDITNAEKNVADVTLSLGEEVTSYEFSDLFRDDKNPVILDLMKFQMFGWTVIAIFIYSWLFLQNLTDSIITLPLVPETIVILTGLSQAGYLAGKGVSNVGSNANPSGTT